MADATAPTIDWDDVQGLVLRGYGKHPYSAVLLLTIDDADKARAWLAGAVDRVTTAVHAAAREDGTYLNVAFAHGGLVKLGLPDAGINAFPTAFLEGMASPNRAQILRDEPVSWDWGGPGKDVHVVVLIFSRTANGREAALASELDALAGFSPVVLPILTQLWPDEVEHFGFRDGISQPIIEGSPASPHAKETTPPDSSTYGQANVIKAGEFLLGYLNEYGVPADIVDLPPGSDPSGLLPTISPDGKTTAPDLGHNGTYLVVRQIQQHVPQLWNYIADEMKGEDAPEPKAAQDWLGAKMIGRWPGGASMALAPDEDDPSLAEANDFVYQAIDPDGLRCPFGSHVRRSNPRDTLGDDPAAALRLAKRHRLIRRARSYGPRVSNRLDLSDQSDRGLMFMCLGANIERQFEFVQQTWIDGPSFNGLYDERDPIFGRFDPLEKGMMTIPRLPVRRRLQGLGGFITVRGGAYFFLPSLRALRYLAATRSPAGS